MITSSRRSDSHIATAGFPEAVGPQMTGIVSADSAPSEAALALIPRQLDAGVASVAVVRRQLAVPQRDEQRAPLLWPERISRFHRGLARDGAGQALLSCGT